MKKYDCIKYYSKTTKDPSKTQEVLELFIKKLAMYLITTGEPVKLPAGMGGMRFFKINVASRNRDKSSKKVYRDYSLSNKLGKVIKLTNMSTGGFWWYFGWYKVGKINVLSRNYYKCTISRPLRRNTSYKIKKDFTVTDFFRDKGWILYSELTKPRLSLQDVL